MIRPGVRVSVRTTHGRPAAWKLLVLVPLVVLFVLALTALMLVLFLTVLALAAAVTVVLILGTKVHRTTVRELPPSNHDL